MRKVGVLLCAGLISILSMIMAYLSYCDQQISEKKADDATKEQVRLLKENARLNQKLNQWLLSEGSKPFLKVSISPEVIDNSSKIEYRVVFFNIINNGTNPLHGLKCFINDSNKFTTLSHGILEKHLGSGSMKSGQSGMTKRDRLKYELEYDNENIAQTFDIGSLAANEKFPVYKTTFSPSILGINPNYNVELSWNNGRIIFFVNLRKDNNGNYFLDSNAEVVLNNVVVKNNSEYIEVN